MPAPLGPMIADQLAVVHVEVAAVEDVDAGHVAGDDLVGAQQGVLGGALVRAAVLARESRAAPGRLRVDSTPAVTATCRQRRRARRRGVACMLTAAPRLGALVLERLLGLGEHLLLLLLGERGVVVRAEVGVDDPLVVHDRVRRALGDDPALRHDDDPVGDVADHVHVVLDEQHGHAVLAQLLDVAEQRLRQRRVHAGHRLVEHDHLGVDHQRPGHLEQLALAAGQAAGEVVALGVELEPGQQVVGARGDLALLRSPERREERGEDVLAVLAGGAEPHVLDDRELGQRLGELEGADHAEPGDLVRGHALERTGRRTTRCPRRAGRSR